VNVVLKRIWKEAIVTCFKTFYQHLFGGTEEGRGNPRSNYWVFCPWPRCGTS